MRICHACRTEWTSEKKEPGVKEYCEKCSAWLHCCLNCRFYNPSKHNQCAIGTTEWVPDKKTANFCDEFEFRDHSRQTAVDSSENRARNALDVLFGEEPRGDAAQPKTLDDLFGG